MTGNAPLSRPRTSGTGQRGVRADGAELRRSSLRFVRDVSLNEWVRLGRHFLNISESVSWWLGDWLIYGRETYPDRYRMAIAETGLDYQTLRNYAWIAAKWPESARCERLSFHHHAEIAALPEPERAEWLRRAVEGGWSRNELRARVRAAQQRPRTTATDVVRLGDIGGDRVRRWQDAASRARKELVEWMTEILDEAATHDAATRDGSR